MSGGGMSGAPTGDGGGVRVAVVGGGFSGAAVALRLSALAGPGGVLAPIVVHEPRERLGSGVAYSSREDAHRINVPADRMSLYPERRSDFVDWMRETGVRLDDAAVGPEGRLFPRRSVFGAYVAARLAPALAEGRVVHRRDAVCGVVRDGSGWSLEERSGARDAAAILVIATSHPSPEPPAALSRAFGGMAGFVTDPWGHGALDAIGRGDRVLVVGSGLSMADVVAALDLRGHRGEIVSVSRRGLASRGHPAGDAPKSGAFADPPERRTLTLLRRVREAVREAALRGEPWQGVLDRVRDEGGAIWGALPLEERRRLVRHLRPFWDTHRFRVAPQPEAAIERLRAEGRFELRAARIEAARAVGGPEGSDGSGGADGASCVAGSGRFEITLRGRGGAVRRERFDAVVTTTGPAHGSVIGREPYLASLQAAGWIEADPVGLGLHVDASSRAVGDASGACDTLFVAGPLARERFGELMGLPEVAAHAAFVAARIGEMFGIDLAAAGAQPGS